MVERKAGKGLADLRSAHDGGDLLGRKQARQKLGEEIRRARRQFRRLQHHAVAGGKCRDQRHDGEVERIVPRADDPDHADRLIENARAGGQQLEADRDPFRPHPTREMAQRVANGRLRRKDLADLRLVTRAVAEVCRDRRSQRSPLRPIASASFFRSARRSCSDGAPARRNACALRIESGAHVGRDGAYCVHSGGLAWIVGLRSRCGLDRRHRGERHMVAPWPRNHLYARSAGRRCRARCRARPDRRCRGLRCGRFPRRRARVSPARFRREIR